MLKRIVYLDCAKIVFGFRDRVTGFGVKLPCVLAGAMIRISKPLTEEIAWELPNCFWKKSQKI